MKSKKVLIIGGGLAGLTAAIHLAKSGIAVTVIEKHSYPRHKVCGEYISNEVLPYFDWLGLDLTGIKATTITDLRFSTVAGHVITTTLPLGGFGISRFALDEYLYQEALSNGCQIIIDQVENVDFDKDIFTISTQSNQTFTADLVLGAFGKRSNIDLKMKRAFMDRKSKWLAVKAHYLANITNNMVSLHNFDGGYCGVSKVENDVVNVCYLVNYDAFKKYKNITDFQEFVMTKNPHLKDLFTNSNLLFEKPLTISQISFDKKQAVEDHIIMIGDTAGLIHPLCGNGMAMAIHSAKIASELIIKYNNNTIESRAALEKEYQKKWKHTFNKRIQAGRFLSLILENKTSANLVLKMVTTFKFILPYIIKQTHGKPLTVES